jgi:colanic acid/amylovoran biosynthesis glycosyltransferase
VGLTPPLRIAIAAHRFPCISETFVLDHVTGLLDRGHDVRVLAERAEGSGALHGDFERYGLAERVRYWSKLPWATKALTALRPLKGMSAANLGRLVRDRGGAPSFAALKNGLYRAGSVGNADILHAHFGDEGRRWEWAKGCAALRARLVISLHGFDVNPVVAAGGSPYAALFRLADRILVTTRFMAGQAMALGCSAEKLVQAPHGIRIEQFDFAERRRQPQEALRLLTVARLVEVKGLEHAIKAVARLAAKGARVEYTIVGDGPLRERLERLSSDLGIRGAITFAGAQSREQARRHYAASHLFILPSHKAADGAQEGQGIVVQEAQACGLPVLATRHGGIPEGCVDGLSAVLVREKDDEALAAGLQALLDREEQWPAMGRAGRRLVESHFTLARQLDTLESLYRSLNAAPAERGP